MDSAITNARINTSRWESSYNPRYLYWICVLFSALILGRSFHDAFFYIFAGVSFFVFVLSKVKYCIPLLFFLLPFATILKLNVDGMSFFTILFFVAILKTMLINRKVDARLLLCIIGCFFYNIFFSGFGQITTIVTMIFGMLMLYYVRNENIDAESVVVSFSLGICLSSVLALFRTSIPIVRTLVAYSMLKLGENDYTTRFSGLCGNPNYYTLDIIVALSAIVVLMHGKKPQKIHTFFMIALSTFGLMSVSKSFLVTWVILLVCWFVLSIRQGAGKFVKFVFILAIGAIVVYFFAFDYINSYIFRLEEDLWGTIESITTGRLHIWVAYIEALSDDFKIFFWGNGLNTMLEFLGKGTHNTYLEAVFSMGILGAILFFISLKASMGKLSLRGVLWIPVILLMIRMFAIGILTYDNLWFYFAVIVCLSLDVKKKESK